MTYIQCTPTQPQLIAVSRLEKSPFNARRTGAKIRAFGDPEKNGRTPDQVESVKTWLPEGVAFHIAAPKPARSKKAKKAA